MTKGKQGTAPRHLDTLFRVGTVGGLTDAQLLERFTSRRDETSELAFAALVDRHGPMVLRVCRAVLRDGHEAHDAFQATFLVLVRRAGSLWVCDSLGPWLHQVAHRTASCARAAEARRRRHEGRAAAAAARSAREDDRDDLGGVIHEEVERLPQRYRAAVVLCLLEGLTPEQAARHLRCPVGTVHSRLARGRERLRSRLARRGVAVPAGMLATALGPASTQGAVPAALLQSTVSAAARVVAGGTITAGAVSAPVALAEGVLSMMALAKMKSGAFAASVALLGISAAGIVWAREGVEGRRAPTGPNRRAATALMVLAPEGRVSSPRGTPTGPGHTFEQIRPNIVAQLKEHGSVIITTLAGVEVSVRLYEEGELEQAEPLLKQVLALGPIGIRGPADPMMPPATAAHPTPAGDIKMGGPESGANTGRVVEGEAQAASGPAQPTRRSGGLIFAASPTGDQVVAYNPLTGDKKSVALHASKEEPIKVTPVGSSGVVGLILEGSKISRIAAFDLKAGKWFVQDLNEPVKGRANVALVGPGVVAYDLGGHCYTFHASAGKWDHFDVRSIGE